MKQLFTLLAFVICVFSLRAQDKTDRTLFVRFKEGKVVNLVDHFIVIDGNSQLQTQMNQLGEWRKTYTIPEEKLDSLVAVAKKNLHKDLPDLNQDYRFVVSDFLQVDHVLNILKKSSAVESVKKAPRLFNCSAPDYLSFQTYLQNTTTGINAEEVWSFYNNHGEGIKIYDIEYFFNSSHADLPVITVCGPTPEDPFGDESSTNHGTAVLGEMAALNNGIGTTGIAYGSDIYFGGANYNNTYELENALIETTLHLNPSDIVLLEQQAAGPYYDPSSNSQYGLVAVEWVKEYYDAIQVVVGQGIIVVEAAGNGQQDLDDGVYSIENDGHYPFLPGNGSGAIIVGAGSSTFDVERSTTWYSNYGSAVEIQGTGESICTTGYGDLYILMKTNIIQQILAEHLLHLRS